MGSLYRLTAALALALGPTAGAHAQDNSAAPVGPSELRGFQLDPSRDPNKPRAPERAGPEIDARLPAATPAPAPAAAQPGPVVVTPPPLIRTVAPPSAPPQGQRATPASGQAPAERPGPSGPRAPEERVPSSAPVPVPDNSAAPPPAASPPVESEPAPRPVDEAQPVSWPWWVAAGATVCAVAAGLLFRRRYSARLEEPVAETPDGGEDATPPEPIPAIVESAPAAAPASEPAPGPEARRARAALALEFAPTGARNTLIGAAVGYRLILRNEGNLAAENVAVAATIANADARQERALAGFFAAPVDAPAHAVARIEPGETVALTGELRLAGEAIVPIQLEDRALLIPLVAFSAHYGWGEGARGYSGGAFIVGQESDPPRPRMAPFRIDQGPRQYRSVGSRPAFAALVT